VTASPRVNLPKLDPEHPRTRDLSEDEIKIFWHGLDRKDLPWDRRTASRSSSSSSPCCGPVNCSVRIGISCSTSTAITALRRPPQASQESAGDPAAVV